MNREYKFRALSENIDGTSDWVYGYLSKCCGAYTINDEDGNGIFVNENTIGQYTGFKDKNGKEIYEGDIITSKLYGDIYRNYVVIWSDDMWEAYEKYSGYYIDSTVWHKYEVIGNIYENQDLLQNGYNNLKHETIEKLKEIIDLLYLGKYEEIEDMFSYFPLSKGYVDFSQNETFSDRIDILKSMKSEEEGNV